jgi:hypothetical protein
MKTLLVLCAAVIGFLALPAIYSTVKGYTLWFWLNPKAQIFVDGQRVSGYLHKSGKVAIVTRLDLSRPRSYWIGLAGQSTATPAYCGSWSAPDFFVFAVGDVNMPCMGLKGIEANSETPDAPDRCSSHINNSTKIEFRTINGNSIRVML